MRSTANCEISTTSW